MIDIENMKVNIANKIINNALDRGCDVDVFLSDSGDVRVGIYAPDFVLVEEADADETAGGN